MKRLILTSMLTAAAMFAQSTPAQPNTATKSTVKKHSKKSTKKSTGTAAATKSTTQK